MAELDVQQVMEETNKELSRDDLTTQVGKAQERQIKLEEKEDTQLPAAGEERTALSRDWRSDTLAVSTAPPANPYAGLTNSGPRKRKAAMEKDGSPGSNAHPHAPAPRKTKKKKAVAPG